MSYSAEYEAIKIMIVNHEVTNLHAIKTLPASSPSYLSLSDDVEIKELLYFAVDSNDSAVLEAVIDLFENSAQIYANDLYNYAYNNDLTGMTNVLYESQITGPNIAEEFGKPIYDYINAMWLKVSDEHYTGKIIDKAEVMSLFNLPEERRYLYYFYSDFADLCYKYNPDLQENECCIMFRNLMRELFIVKLKVYDSRLETDAENQLARVQKVEHEGNKRVIWTEAQNTASIILREKLEEVFSPLLKEMPAKKINLYVKEGGTRVDALNEGINIDFPPGEILNELSSYTGEIFHEHAHHGDDCVSHFKSIDHANENLLWAAISTQYIKHANDADIDVYLPDGEIATSSFFWNYELNMIQQMTKEAHKNNGTINYYQFKPEIKTELASIAKHIAEISKKLEAIKKEQNTLSGDTSEQSQNRLKILEENVKTLKAESRTLADKKYDLASKEENWEKIPFEQLTFKGLKHGDKKLTVGAMIKVADQMKAIVKKRSERKISNDISRKTMLKGYSTASSSGSSKPQEPTIANEANEKKSGKPKTSSTP